MHKPTLAEQLIEPTELPMALPSAHLTVARWFEYVVTTKELQPRMCRVFNEDLIYFFYGGVFYRTANRPTKNAAELPVAFLFSPTILPSFFRYYPFDTGALASGMYGEDADPLVPFEDTFEVSGAETSAPSRLVYNLYDTNRRYLEGTVKEIGDSSTFPLRELISFLAADLTKKGIDKRHAVIECHANQPIVLNRELLWIGFPESMMDVFSNLYQLVKPHVPEYYAYRSHVVFNPTEIAAQLELKAAEVVKRFEEITKAASQ